MLRIGVIGAGGHSKRTHGPALAHCRDARPDEIELRAVCDLDGDRRRSYADRFGFAATYGSVDEMVDREPLDAVVAVTPVSTTREIAGDLLARDVAVLVEKPPGETVEAARELSAIAARHDAAHAVSFNRRFNPAVVRAREWLAEHAAERPPTHAISRLLRTDRSQADFVKNTGIHAVDTVHAVLGRPLSASVRRRGAGPASSSGAGSAGRVGTGHGCVAQATFADPEATAHFTVAADAGARAETCELVGPGYDVRIDLDDTRLTVLADGDEALRWRCPDDAPACERDGTLGETRAFLDAVRRGEGFAPTLSEAVPSLELAAAMNAGEGFDGR